MVPNNSDATFKKWTRKLKLSDLLLHYTYGAAAVKHWGRGVDVLQDLTKPPRLNVPVSALAGPSTIIHDRSVAIRKREEALVASEAGAGKAIAGAGRARARAGELVESEGQAMWDEDDVMLFFWGNSRAAEERHLKRDNENTERMEKWREAVP